MTNVMGKKHLWGRGTTVGKDCNFKQLQNWSSSKGIIGAKAPKWEGICPQVQSKITKHLEGNVGENIHNLGLGKYLWYKQSKSVKVHLTMENSGDSFKN